MKNPCNNCKTRWLCKPYGGRCFVKKLYLKRVSKRIADQVVGDFEIFWNNILEKLERRAEDVDQTKA